MKMILADDEAIITRGLQKLMDWPSLGVDIVGIYENGKAAFDGKIPTCTRGIGMPRFSGIDLCI